MRNVLLVEPAYRSKFPPLGLMRISAMHKTLGDKVTFVRGRESTMRDLRWHRVYVSSLFTYELPRTVRTVKYYEGCVPNTSDLVVGGIGATLMPDYIRNRVECRVIEGTLDAENSLGLGERPVAEFTPDYDMLASVDYRYRPEDAYFARVTIGCIRKCEFCAVRILEPEFRFLQGVATQVDSVRRLYGERQNLVVMDNNILAIDCLPRVVDEIADQGFHRGAKRNRRKRWVDFNQGIDARLIDGSVAGLLSRLSVEPIRLAFDYDDVEPAYTRAVKLLADVGFDKFTTYVMFNYKDTPESFYRRLCHNVELSQRLGIAISSFPMRYVPIDDVERHHVGEFWTWRYLRGIQCVLNATRGVVSCKPDFFAKAFGSTFDEFVEIVSMPDNYIIHRLRNEDKAADWVSDFRKLSESERLEFIDLLGSLHGQRNLPVEPFDGRFGYLLRHYYPAGPTVTG